MLRLVIPLDKLLFCLSLSNLSLSSFSCLNLSRHEAIELSDRITEDASSSLAITLPRFL